MILVTTLLPLLDVLTEVGFASAYPQLLTWYGTNLRASSVVAVGPLAAVATGWLWGRIVRRRGLGDAVWLAVLGWSAAVLFMVAGLDSFVAMITARALQGGFAAGFAAIPFIAATTFGHGDGNRSLRSRRMSRIEVAASIGAISGPVTVGSGIVLAPRITLAAVALVPVFALIAPWRRLKAVFPDRPAGVNDPARALNPAAAPKPDAHPHSSRHIPPRLHRLLLPVLYASIVGLLLSAFELLVPTVVEARTARPLLGKVAAMAFEIAVVAGVIIKARLTGVSWWVPVLAAAMIASSFVAASNLVALVAILLVVGCGIGAQVSMGNELAARSMRGFETTGMGAYATLRITGSFVGPLFLTIPFPLVLAVLAVVSLLALAPVLRQLRYEI